jgi:hypothetical protein
VKELHQPAGHEKENEACCQPNEVHAYFSKEPSKELKQSPHQEGVKSQPFDIKNVSR